MRLKYKPKCEFDYITLTHLTETGSSFTSTIPVSKAVSIKIKRLDI